MAALEPEEKRRRSPLSYTQEIPLLEQLLASKTHPDLSGGVGIRSLRRSTLGGVDERLEELLRIAIENEQTERAAKIISLQESFDQLRRRLEQSMNQALNPDDIDLFSPLDLLKAPSASSSSSSSAAASSSSPSPSSSNEEDDDFEVFTWLSPTAETTADAANSCSVCWEPLLEGASLAACDDEHVFCLSCWRAHFEVLITEADLITPLGCLATGCKAEATQPEIARLVGDELFQRYLRFSVLAVVRRDARTRWCPALRCEQHVTITDESSPSVQCPACSTQFCPRCSRSPHPGAACKREFTEAHKEISKWLSKLGMRKAKRCPRCRELVEKSDGCNHMTCRCGQGWCWICGWGFEDNHGSYQHFSTGDSLCLGLQFSGSDSLREARDRALGGPGSYKAYRILHGIETPRQRRLRIFEHGYGTPHPRVVDLKDTDDEEGLGGLFG